MYISLINKEETLTGTGQENIDKLHLDPMAGVQVIRGKGNAAFHHMKQSSSFCT